MGLTDIRRTLGDAHVIGETHDPPMKYLLCRANDLADATSRTQATRKLPGIESVEVTLNREILVSTDLVHTLLRRKVREWEQAYRSA